MWRFVPPQCALPGDKENRAEWKLLVQKVGWRWTALWRQGQEHPSVPAGTTAGQLGGSGQQGASLSSGHEGPCL